MWVRGAGRGLALRARNEEMRLKASVGRNAGLSGNFIPGRGGKFKVHLASAFRMPELQTVRTQFQAAGTFRIAIFPVADQGISVMRHLHPDLVMASGLKPDLDECGRRVLAFVYTDSAVVEAGGFRAWRVR